MRFAISFVVGMVITCVAAQRSAAQPRFESNSLPSVVYPGTQIVFDVAVSGGGAIVYDLISAPTNTTWTLIGDRGVWPRITWNTPGAEGVGTTNLFQITATDELTLLSATNLVMMVVIPLPPLQLLQVSNHAPVLQCTGLLTNKSYLVEWTTSLPATNWTVLSGLWYPPTSVTVTDTNPPSAQKFYRMRAFPELYCIPPNCP